MERGTRLLLRVRNEEKNAWKNNIVFEQLYLTVEISLDGKQNE